LEGLVGTKRWGGGSGEVGGRRLDGVGAGEEGWRATGALILDLSEVHKLI